MCSSGVVASGVVVVVADKECLGCCRTLTDLRVVLVLRMRAHPKALPTAGFQLTSGSETRAVVGSKGERDLQ